MDEGIPITAAAPWAESRVDGGGPISHADVAEEIWQAIRQKAAGERDVPPIGLVVQGGGMRGVYSMAVLAAFEEMGWTRCFDHVAGASAGAMNGAHFITGQARYGVETYIDHLSNRKFIDFFRLRKLVDLDYMIDDLVRHVRPFNLPALLEASTVAHCPRRRGRRLRGLRDEPIRGCGPVGSVSRHRGAADPLQSVR
jgi:hypothetical protein